MLIAIGAYMSAEVPFDFQRLSFQQWLANRPEVQHILSSIQYPESMIVEPATPARLTATISQRRTGSMGGIVSPMQTNTTLAVKATQAVNK